MMLTMVGGIGIDIIEIERVERLLSRHADRLDRVFTASEIAYCASRRKPGESYAARFAVKEAVLKAIGIGWRGGVAWTDVETVLDPLGAPSVVLRGETLQRSRDRGIVDFRVSISHSQENAVALVVACTGAQP
jgi:holo-[acyl-carrier protein] synthase